MTRWNTTLTSQALQKLVAMARRRRPEVGAAAPVLVGEGISTLAYAFAAPDGEWVLRVSRRYPDPWTWRGGRGHEVALLGTLRDRGVPVPAGATVIEEVNGLPAAILERRIVGTSLTPEMVATNPRLIPAIAGVLDRFHTVAVDDSIVQAVPRDDPIAEFRQALAAVSLPDGLRQRVEAGLAFLETRAGLRVLCHRDFRVEHLIVSDRGELVGLLDLGEIGVDDPAVDLAFLHGELGPEVVARICAAMDTADPQLGLAARTFHSLWPLLELAPGGESWGDPVTARDRLEALV